MLSMLSPDLNGMFNIGSSTCCCTRPATKNIVSNDEAMAIVCTGLFTFPTH